MCNHFQVAYFSIEDLEFDKPKLNPKSFNRKTKNLWCRTHQSNLISKYCQNLGIQLIQVNPAYSSFVGNLMNEYYDPISAAAEIARRGMIYKKLIVDDWYPGLNRFRLDSLKTHVPDLEVRGLNIQSLFKLVNSLKLGYRRLDKPHFKFKLIKCQCLH
jgi:IS605 OrfB family transposase